MKTRFNTIWMRFLLIILLEKLTLFASSSAAAPQPLESLPVVLLGSGNWLDRDVATQHLNMVLRLDEQALVLTNSWIYGTNIVASNQQFCGGLLLLSNAWIYTSGGISEEAFWNKQGLGGAPIEVSVPNDFDMPGKPEFYLMVAGNRVLPFIGRRGTMGVPSIWALPKIPVKTDSISGKNADISRCDQISFNGNNVELSGWLEPLGTRQTWHFSPDGGMLRLRITVSKKNLD
jgi:hypothetical protein